jgi:DNA-binding transcriptional LysR family regulator
MDRLEIRELVYFVTVAEELHFSRAADRLGIAQPPLSRAISRLERRLGVTLFDRTSRRVSLTAAGRVFLDESRAVLASMDAAVRRTQQAERSNRLVVAVRPGKGSGLLADVLSGFGRRADAVPVEILFTRRQVDAVRDGRADVGLACGTEDLDDLRTADLIEESPVALLPAGHRLATRSAVTIADLRQTDCFSEQCPDSSLDEIIDLVALRRLVVIVTESIAEKLGPEVVALPVVDVPASLLVLSWAREVPRPALTAFVREAERVAARRSNRSKVS